MCCSQKPPQATWAASKTATDHIPGWPPFAGDGQPGKPCTNHANVDVEIEVEARTLPGAQHYPLRTNRLPCFVL